MNIFIIYAIIHIVCMTGNFIIINKERYELDKDGIISLSILVPHIFLLYNISKYYKKIFTKTFKSNFYEWGDIIEHEGREGIILEDVGGYCYVIFKDNCNKISFIVNSEISFIYKSPVKEELQDLERAMKLQKEADSLYAKLKNKKKTIYNS